MKKARTQPTKVEDARVRLSVDTGSGRWFVLERTGDVFRLIAGPFQTIGAVERLVDNYTPPDEVDAVFSIRCEGNWHVAVGLAKVAIGVAIVGE